MLRLQLTALSVITTSLHFNIIFIYVNIEILKRINHADIAQMEEQLIRNQ